MQLTVTVDSGAVATAAGKDPSAVDHWLSSTAGTVEQEVVGFLADAARAVDPALADAPPPDAATGAAATDTTTAAADQTAAEELAALEAALDSLPPPVKAMVQAHLYAQKAPPAGGGSPV